jgi:hypothetical protein
VSHAGGAADGGAGRSQGLTDQDHREAIGKRVTGEYPANLAIWSDVFGALTSNGLFLEARPCCNPRNNVDVVTNPLIW